MHDTTLQVMDIKVGKEDNENLLILQAITGIIIPMGQGKGMPVMTGIYNVPMGRKQALIVADAIKTVAEELPEPQEPSKIITANNMNEVKQEADLHSKLESSIRG